MAVGVDLTGLDQPCGVLLTSGCEALNAMLGVREETCPQGIAGAAEHHMYGATSSVMGAVMGAAEDMLQQPFHVRECLVWNFVDCCGGGGFSCALGSVCNGA